MKPFIYLLALFMFNIFPVNAQIDIKGKIKEKAHDQDEQLIEKQIEKDFDAEEEN